MEVQEKLKLADVEPLLSQKVRSESEITKHICTSYPWPTNRAEKSWPQKLFNRIHEDYALSSAARGGIVGGILGILLLISAIVIFCLLRRRSHPALTPVSQFADTRVDAFEKGYEADPGRNTQKAAPDVQIDHRLRVSNEDIVDGEI